MLSGPCRAVERGPEEKLWREPVKPFVLGTAELPIVPTPRQQPADQMISE